MKKFLLAAMIAAAVPGLAHAQNTVPSIAPPPVPTVPPANDPHAVTAAPVPSRVPAEIVAPSASDQASGPVHAAPFSGSPATGSSLGDAPVPGKSP